MRRRDIMSTYCTASSSDRFEFLYEYYHNYKNILSCERHCVIYMIESFMMKNHWEKYCKTNAVGLYVKRGKYGGTFAHKDIAFEFASAISPVFKLYLIKEFQRLKEAENDLQKLEWDAKRFLSKNNYLIQTDAVKNYLIPVCNYREDLQWLPYAEEADLLNVALFGFTAKAWREANPELAKKSNVRDYATINELTVLSNLESHNAQMIREGMDKKDRFEALKEIAEYQLRVLNEAEKISNRIEEQ